MPEVKANKGGKVYVANKAVDEENPNEEHTCASSTTGQQEPGIPMSNGLERRQEHLHVEYNAWEFQGSDVLWGALVDKIFHAVCVSLAVDGCTSNLLQHQCVVRFTS